VNRYALAIVGGLTGVAARLLLVQPLSAFFAPATVVWDASGCPAGIYTITAVARGGYPALAYSVTTSGVSLPKGAIVQEFPDLPAGTYQVSATATGNNGRTFTSETQAIRVGSEVSGDRGSIFGRSRPPGTPATGLARSRKQPAEPTPPPPTDRRLAPSAVNPNTPPTDASRRRLDALPEPQVRRLLALLTDDSSGSDRQWRRIDMVDDDADGVVDYVAVESISGEIWIYRFHGP